MKTMKTMKKSELIAEIKRFGENTKQTVPTTAELEKMTNAKLLALYNTLQNNLISQVIVNHEETDYTKDLKVVEEEPKKSVKKIARPKKETSKKTTTKSAPKKTTKTTPKVEEKVEEKKDLKQAHKEFLKSLNVARDLVADKEGVVAFPSTLKIEDKELGFIPTTETLKQVEYWDNKIDLYCAFYWSAKLLKENIYSTFLDEKPQSFDNDLDICKVMFIGEKVIHLVSLITETTYTIRKEELPFNMDSNSSVRYSNGIEFAFFGVAEDK